MARPLRLELEWREADGVADAAVARTWSRYGLYAQTDTGEVAITECADSRAAGSIRSSVYGSLLPLTEWILRHWYEMLFHRREPAPGERGRRAWRHMHAWRHGAEGMALPDVSVFPAGDSVILQWTAEGTTPETEDVRFLRSGHAFTSAEDWSQFLVGLLDTITRRIEGLDSPRARELASDWQRQRAAPESEVRAKRALARLGIPSDEASPELLDRLGSSPASPVFDAMLDACNPDRIQAAATLAEAVWTDCLASAAFPGALLAIRRRVSGGTSDAATETAWNVGWSRARALRAAMPSLAPNGHVPADEIARVLATEIGVAGSVVRSEDSAIDSVVAWAANRAPVMKQIRTDQGLSPQTQSFRLARGIHELVFGGRHDADHAWASSSHLRTSLSIANAFAAELLVPADSLSRDLASAGVIDSRILRQVARKWRVHPLLVYHQIANHQLAPLSDELSPTAP